jgi:hypothetical protein
MPGEDLVGWYDVTLKVLSTTQCRLRPQDTRDEWRAKVEVTKGRRGLVLHLEQLKSWFTQPVLITVRPDSSFVYDGQTPVDLGMFVVPVNFTLGGGIKPDRQSFDARFTAKHPYCAFEGTMSGSRTEPPPPPPSPGASLNSDGYVTPPSGGVSVFTDSAIPYTPPPEQPQPQGPSPLINGRYLTTLSVTESRCMGRDNRGTWRGTLNLEPGRPAILIPLQEYGPIFGGPLILNVDSLMLKQTSSEIPINVGLVSGSVPATFNGNFDADGSRFQVRFEAGTNFCRIGGTIAGARS